MDESGLKFSEDHIWLLEMGAAARIGISDYAQEQLGEITSVTAAEIGRFVEIGDAVAELDAQKTVVELLAPVSGTLKALNEAVIEDPSLINVDPYGKGWIVEIELTEPEELERLMNFEEYETFTED